MVIDTNVYLSALVYGGNPRRIVEMIVSGEITVIVSEHIFVEMRRIILKKFPQFEPEYRALEMFLHDNTIAVPLGGVEVAVCRDPKDNAVLETATTGDCNAIVTGDADLLTLGNYNSIAIVTPAAFIAMQ